MDYNLIPLLRREIEQRRMDLAESLLRGGVQDYAAYCRAVGYGAALFEIDLRLQELEETQRLAE